MHARMRIQHASVRGDFFQVLQQGSWLAEYYVGAKKTFYSVEFSPAFTGVLFADAVVHIFEYFEVCSRKIELNSSCTTRLWAKLCRRLRGDSQHVSIIHLPMLMLYVGCVLCRR